MSPPNPTHLPAGAVLAGRYRVLRALGEGGAGVVYEVEDTASKTRCALKLLRPHDANDPERMRRVVQEARSLPRLTHDHAVALLDVDVAPEGPFVVYELLVEPRDLHALLHARGRLSPDEALDLMLPVMEALAAAHALGRVHGDLKPGAIVLIETPRGVVPKVTDASLEDLLMRGHDERSLSLGPLMGNPRYLAPEQLTDRGRVDARADVWSIGVVLYELMAGAHPFDAGSTPETIVRIVSGAMTPLAARVPSLSPQRADAIQRALTPCEARYATMQAFIDALRSPPEASPPPPDATDARVAPQNTRGLGAMRWAAAVALLALLALALLLARRA